MTLSTVAFFCFPNMDTDTTSLQMLTVRYKLWDWHPAILSQASLHGPGDLLC